MLLILLLSLLYLKTGMQTNYYILVTEKSQMTRTTAKRVVTAATAIDTATTGVDAEATLSDKTPTTKTSSGMPKAKATTRAQRRSRVRRAERLTSVITLVLISESSIWRSTASLMRRSNSCSFIFSMFQLFL